jgi:uncharacterized protein YjdB
MIEMIRRRLRSSIIVALILGAHAACEDEEVPPETRVTVVEILSGDQQVAVVASALPAPLVARALDAQGRAVARAPVEWTVAAGGGTVSPLAATTDENGEARATWTVGESAGAHGAQIRIGAITAVFGATARPGAAATVTLTPSSVLLDAIGATAEIEAVARDAFDNVIDDRTPVWSSTDAAVAAVDGDGTVRAVRPGAARVRATLDGVSGEAQVDVQPQPASVVVDPPAAQLGALGATAQFAASARDRNGNPVGIPAAQFAWSSSAPLIVSVGPSGLATAQAPGQAQVRAALGTLVGQAQVVVQQTAVSVDVTPAADTLTSARPTVQLTVTGVDANGHAIAQPSAVWTTSAAGIAIVSQAGLVTAVSNGVARIRATSGSARDSATITVRLNSAPKAVIDSVAAIKDMQTQIAAPGVLANDTAAIPPATVASFGGGSLGGVVTAHAAGTTATFGMGGSLTVNADGSIAFTPATGFTGTFTFQYRAQNAVGTSDATVVIQVGLPPVAMDDAYPAQAGVPLAVPAPGVRLNDDAGTLPAVVASFGGTALGGTTVTSFPAGQTVGFGIGGFLRVDADGSLAFTAPAGFTGAFTFQYRLRSAVGSSDAIVTITVN